MTLDEFTDMKQSARHNFLLKNEDILSADDFCEYGAAHLMLMAFEND